ncbi:MAG: TolC family protein [Bacteroidota bacterium]|nr:TolC family protein [Bacteroidota bacterium]
MKLIINSIILMILGITVGQAQTLDDYFRIAAENNPGLQAKYKEFEASLQKVPQVNTLPDPTFSFGYFISPVETRVGPQRAKFSLTQMFPWFGTLKAQGDAAALLAESKYQAFVEARNKLYFQVASAYYPLYELKKWVELERENIEILESYKNIALSNFENGKSKMVDVLRVDIMLKEAITNLHILNEKEKPLLTALNKLLNRKEDAEIVIQDSLGIELIANDFRKDSMIAGNPVLKELKLKEKASRAAGEAANKKGLPKMGIGLDYVLVGERTDMSVADNGKDVIMPMLSVSLPIFRKKYDAAVKEAQLQQEAFELMQEDYKNTLTVEYESIQFRLDMQEQKMALYEDQIAESKQALRLLGTAYANSGTDFEEVLRMQQQLIRYQKLKATALSEYNIAIEKLNYITALNRTQK